MKEDEKEVMKFRARISKTTVINFTFKDLFQDRFFGRSLLIPWLEKGNIPDIFIYRKDRNGEDIYTNDAIRRIGDSYVETFIGVVELRDGVFIAPSICFNTEHEDVLLYDNSVIEIVK